MTDESRSEDRKPTDTTSESIACRTCGASVAQDAETFPFCSDRCRMADLGAWFDGDYRISREIKDSDLETVD